MTPILRLILVVLLTWAGPALAKQKLCGIYSSLYFHEEGGDLLGMELLIHPSGHDDTEGYSVFVQIAEGGSPYTAIVPLIVHGKQIEFTLPGGEAYDRLKLIGTFANDSTLIVTWPGSGNKETLKRGKSYWE